MDADDRPTRSPRADEKRAQIRRAAYASFRDGGYHDTTVDDVCARAGISKGSFYWHYASKQEVFVDILETWTREVMGEMLVQFEEAVGQPDRYAHLADALAREVHRGRAIVPLWLEFTVQARQDAEIRGVVAGFYRRARAAIAEMLRPHVGGEVVEEELQAAAATIFAAYAGLVLQDLCDPEWANAERNVASFLRLLGRILSP